MKARGFIIFPGRLALAETFRIGCMGDVTEQDMAEAMNAVAEFMQEWASRASAGWIEFQFDGYRCAQPILRQPDRPRYMRRMG